ncbi:hypothetical protein AWC19_03010 [Mycobacterium palustre]|uniref:Uncharacterized protein n=1 Tax=Mycobacterium palustre TaxID=153971 RepID=A0A1X1ZU35_9MYCO|nr:hypothetical protein AWC19_03010 [Mycobacterium palustre]
MVVIISDSSQPRAQAIYCVCPLFECVSFNLKFFRQIKMMFLALLEAGDQVVSGVPLILRRQ